MKTMIMIRVPDILRKWIEEEAAADDRTMSAECRRILEAERQRQLATREQDAATHANHS